jgi:DNA polymerase-3 subunit gamma/tau
MIALQLNPVNNMRTLSSDWQKILELIDIPSTRMLLAQQAKLIEVRPTALSSLRARKLFVKIAVNKNWIGMIQSRTYILENAFNLFYGFPVNLELVGA